MNLVLLVSFLIVALSIKSQENHLKQNHDANWISKDGSSWSGYYPQCNYQCVYNHKGQVCNTNPTVCCQQGQCQSKYGFQTCKSAIFHFSCDPSNHMRNQNQQFFMKQQPRLRKYMRPKTEK